MLYKQQYISLVFCLMLVSLASSQTFTRVTTGAIVNDGGLSLGNSWGDYDNDGDLDLFVTNSGGNNFLYLNNGNGNFVKITSGPVVTDGGFSYGSSWGDFNNDGALDLFVANLGGNNFLYRNNGSGNFGKIINGSIVTDNEFSGSSSWGDYDNDGDLDLFVANWVFIVAADNFLFQNSGDGSFDIITNGLVVTDGGDSRGSSWGDFDNDGDIDLFVTNSNNENNFLYRNDGGGNFVKITNGPPGQ